MVIFHGRNFQETSNQRDLFNGSYLSQLGDIVVVVPYFRLGVFGFLKTPLTGAPGNAGLLDQILALDWISSNIGQFGGDASKVRYKVSYVSHFHT